MVNQKSILSAFAAMILASCAAPKAVVVEAAPAPKNEAPVPEVAAVAPQVPAMKPDDGLRMPDMLALPSESEFRATGASPVPKSPAESAVISRPPTEPPPRVKPPAPAGDGQR